MNKNQNIEDCLEILGPLSDGFSIEDIKSQSRDSDLVRVRSYIAVILREKGFTLQNIGNVLGGRTHATVINLLKYDCQKQCRDNVEYRRNIKEIVKKCNLKGAIAQIEYLQKQIDKLKKNL